MKLIVLGATGSTGLEDEVLGRQAADEVRRSALLHLANMGATIAHNRTTARNVLDAERLTYTETEVAQIRFPNRPGELARASGLGEANSNGLCAADAEPVLLDGLRGEK
jgi:hypothetical protein